MAAHLKTCTLLKKISFGCLSYVHRESVYRSLTGKRGHTALLRSLFKKRQEVGPEPVRHPSAFGCWSYDAEIFSFSKRLSEDIDESTLKLAFITRNYVNAEIEEKKKLGLKEYIADGDSSEVSHNTLLVQKGAEISSKYIKAFIRYNYPYIFEEAISDINDYLMSDEILTFVSKRIGTTDLIKSTSYPPSEEELKDALLAIIGAIAESQDEKRAGNFVKDFIMVQLVGKDINELWNLINPIGALNIVLKSMNRGEPEPRILWQSAKNTLMAVYYVGIYSDKKLIGKSPGETVEIAEEMAARDALKNIMKTHDARRPLKFDLDFTSDVVLNFEETNPSIEKLVIAQNDQPSQYKIQA